MPQPDAKPVPRCDAERILIVDDEEPIRKLFLMILSSCLPSLKADEARNGIEAVRLFNERHHGVIMMDLRMPEMDGLQAFLSIERSCTTQAMKMPPVIFCTGFVPPDGVASIVGKGTYHLLLRKPVRSEDIINSVTSRLDLAKQQAAAINQARET